MNRTEIEKKILRELGPEFDHSAKPHVYFFDYAVQIEDGARPRYRNAVYISKRSKTAHDTQDFRRKASDEDKAEFPREWEYYLKVRENLALPKVDLLPGIDQATLMEMKAMNLYNLEQLVEQDDFEHWTQMARRILDAISDDSGEGRQAVRGNSHQQPERVLAGNRTIENTGGSEPAYFSGKKESHPQKSHWQAQSPGEITFNFEVSQ